MKTMNLMILAVLGIFVGAEITLAQEVGVVGFVNLLGRNAGKNLNRLGSGKYIAQFEKFSSTGQKTILPPNPTLTPKTNLAGSRLDSVTILPDRICIGTADTFARLNVFNSGEGLLGGGIIVITEGNNTFSLACQTKGDGSAGIMTEGDYGIWAIGKTAAFYGYSVYGKAVHGSSLHGYAGYFNGKGYFSDIVEIKKALEVKGPVKADELIVKDGSEYKNVIDAMKQLQEKVKALEDEVAALKNGN